MGRPEHGDRDHARGVQRIDGDVEPARAGTEHEVGARLEQQTGAENLGDDARGPVVAIVAPDDGEHRARCDQAGAAERRANERGRPHRRIARTSAATPATSASPPAYTRP